MSQAVIKVRHRDAKKTLFRKNYKNQITGFFMLIIILSAILLGGWKVEKWIKDPSQLRISRLVIIGERRFTTNDDIRRSILSLGPIGTVITQNVYIIQHQIEQLPWIKKASVRTQWPDEIKVYLIEYIPVARWNDVLMVDDDGKPFSVPTDRIGNQITIMLYGPKGSEQDVLAGYKSMNMLLTSSGFQIKSVIMTARHSWKLILQDDIQLDLGRYENYSRLQRFIEIYPILKQHAKLYNKRINYINLRHSTGIAVGWAPIITNADNGN